MKIGKTNMSLNNFKIRHFIQITNGSRKFIVKLFLQFYDYKCLIASQDGLGKATLLRDFKLDKRMESPNYVPPLK